MAPSQEGNQSDRCFP